jgi:putative ABC transport system permease protein
MLWRKMWRDLTENKAAYLACITVIAIGLMLYTSMSVVFEGLNDARNNFYAEYRFADGFAQVRGISQTQADRLAAVEGVAQLEGRLVKDAQVLFSDREENVYLRLVSIRPEQTDRLNDVRIVEGNLPSAGTRGILLDPGFLAANALQLGDKLPVIIAGNQVELTVTGTAQSPEFIYAMRTPMDIYPDPATFGVAYLPLDVMQKLYGEESLNDLAFTLAAGYTYPEVESQLKPRLKSCGMESIYARKDQVSEVILKQELQSMQSMVTTMPLLFLIVAATILYILLKRMVEQQRGQIGVLKALGYSSRTILFHYLSYALIIGAVGGILGSLLGFWLSYPLMGVYQTFFNLPGLTGQVSIYYLVLGTLFSTGFGALAGYFGSKGVLKLQPAEAMRPPAPPQAKQTLIEGWRLFWNNLTVQGKMATRNLFRNLSRSLFTLIGVMFAFSLISTTGYFLSIIDVLMVDQFTKVQTHDVKVVYTNPTSGPEARHELAHWPGVTRFEAYLEVPATLNHTWHEKSTVILGLEPDTEMYNILTKDGVKVPLPAEGIILSQTLAENLQAKVGSRLEIESPYAKDSPVYTEVVDIVPQYLGVNAYMEISALGRLLEQGNISTAALLAVEEGAFPELKEHYREAAGVFSVEEKGAALQKFNEMMDSYGYTMWVLALFGMLTGFAVIYNSGIVSLSERKRELASLRVMGMTPGEVLQVLAFEQWFVSIFGMLAGIPMTMLFIKGMASMVDSDLFSFPVVFELQSFIMGTAGTVASIWLTHWVIARKIRQLSMVEVLKERD